jgi:hypothetical protein
MSEGGARKEVKIEVGRINQSDMNGWMGMAVQKMETLQRKWREI